MRLECGSREEDTMPRPYKPLAADLRRAVGRIRAWRRTRTRRRLSAELWRLAIDMAGRHGVSAAAKALGVDYYALRRRAPSTAAASFVEIVGAAATAPCVVEIEDGRGGTMRVRLSGADTVAHVEALGRILWGRPG